VHSGDSACSLPAHSLSPQIIERLNKMVKDFALELNVVGLMNTQFAIQGDDIYILEVNPRGSRSVPFVSKATGQALAKIAARCMVGKSLAEQGELESVIPPYYSVKVSVFPFSKFPEADPILGPEMKSTGEVMGVGATFAEGYAKAQLGGGASIPTEGAAFISVRDRDKPRAAILAKTLIERGFTIVATGGTADFLNAQGLECERINKVHEGQPHIVDKIKNNEIQLIVNTTEGKKSIRESETIRRAAVVGKVTYYTTMTAGLATCEAMAHLQNYSVNQLKELHKQAAA
jgi:carbamoyl-phosphate synthase large subunit